MEGPRPAPDESIFRVDPHWRGLRLDLYLKAMVPAVSRAKLQRYLAAGCVRVEGEVAGANRRVQPGEEVRFLARFGDEDETAAARVPVRVLHEDEAIVVVDKPAGVHVHPVSGHRFDTLLAAVELRVAGRLAPGERITLAHRLDRDTSGVVVFARSAAVRRTLQDAFERRLPEKTYLALVEGRPVQDAGTIDLPLAAAPAPRAVRKALVRDDGKPALTRYRVLERLRDARGAASLVELHPETGRQHQLRAHLAAIDHPILCDDRYGRAAPRPPLLRCALHAARLVLPHPLTGVPTAFEAPLPDDMAGWLAAARR